MDYYRINPPPYKDLALTKAYSPAEYPVYDNFNAINVNRTKDIPVDYTGIIGVPLSFMDKYNPDRFELIGTTDDINGNGGKGIGIGGLLINGKKIYKRIFIKNRHPSRD